MRTANLVCFLVCVAAAACSSSEKNSTGGTGTTGSGGGGGYYNPTTSGSPQGNGGFTAGNGQGGSGGAGGAENSGGAGPGANGSGGSGGANAATTGPSSGSGGSGGGDGSGGGTTNTECCEAVGAVGCGDARLEECVCGFDSYCCEREWDDMCIEIAAAECGECPDVIVVSNCCEESPASGCRDPIVEACVCRLDAFCCEEEWDETCVDYANLECDGC